MAATATDEQRSQQARDAAVAAAAGGGAAAAIAAVPVPPTGAAAAATTTAYAAGILAALRRFLRRVVKERRTAVAEALGGGRRPDELRAAYDLEERLAEEFQRASEERVANALRTAAEAATPEARQQIVRTALENERRWAVQSGKAAMARVAAAADVVKLKRESPQGVFWKLDTSVKEHTPDCLILGGRAWPWKTIERVGGPPRHPGCPCRLLSLQEAKRAGLQTRLSTDDPDALKARLDALEEALREEREQRERERAARERGDGPLEEAGTALFSWKGHLHPRDAYGKFIETLNLLAPKQSVAISSSTKVTKDPNGTYRLTRGATVYRGFATPEDAAFAAAELSARAKGADEIGGDKAFDGFDDYLTAAGVDVSDLSIGGKLGSKEAIAQASTALLARENAAKASSNKYVKKTAPLLAKRRAGLEKKLSAFAKGGGLVAPPVKAGVPAGGAAASSSGGSGGGGTSLDKIKGLGPGETVTINGRTVTRQSDGSFTVQDADGNDVGETKVAITALGLTSVAVKAKAPAAPDPEPGATTVDVGGFTAKAVDLPSGPTEAGQQSGALPIGTGLTFPGGVTVLRVSFDEWAVKGVGETRIYGGSGEKVQNPGRTAGMWAYLQSKKATKTDALSLAPKPAAPDTAASGGPMTFTATQLPSGKWRHEVKDATGKVLATRTSEKHYTGAVRVDFAPDETGAWKFTTVAPKPGMLGTSKEYGVVGAYSYEGGVSVGDPAKSIVPMPTVQAIEKLKPQGPGVSSTASGLGFGKDPDGVSVYVVRRKDGSWLTYRDASGDRKESEHDTASKAFFAAMALKGGTSVQAPAASGPVWVPPTVDKATLTGMFSAMKPGDVYDVGGVATVKTNAFGDWEVTSGSTSSMFGNADEAAQAVRDELDVSATFGPAEPQGNAAPVSPYDKLKIAGVGDTVDYGDGVSVQKGANEFFVNTPTETIVQKTISTANATAYAAQQYAKQQAKQDGTTNYPDSFSGSEVATALGLLPVGGKATWGGSEFRKDGPGSYYVKLPDGKTKVGSSPEMVVIPATTAQSGAKPADDGNPNAGNIYPADVSDVDLDVALDTMLGGDVIEVGDVVVAAGDGGSFAVVDTSGNLQGGAYTRDTVRTFVKDRAAGDTSGSLPFDAEKIQSEDPNAVEALEKYLGVKFHPDGTPMGDGYADDTPAAASSITTVVVPDDATEFAAADALDAAPMANVNGGPPSMTWKGYAIKKYDDGSAGATPIANSTPGYNGLVALSYEGIISKVAAAAPQQPGDSLTDPVPQGLTPLTLTKDNVNEVSKTMLDAVKGTGFDLGGGTHVYRVKAGFVAVQDGKVVGGTSGPKYVLNRKLKGTDLSDPTLNWPSNPEQAKISLKGAGVRLPVAGGGGAPAAKTLAAAGLPSPAQQTILSDAKPGERIDFGSGVTVAKVASPGQDGKGYKYVIVKDGTVLGATSGNVAATSGARAAVDGEAFSFPTPANEVAPTDAEFATGAGPFVADPVGAGVLTPSAAPAPALTLTQAEASLSAMNIGDSLTLGGVEVKRTSNGYDVGGKFFYDPGNAAAYAMQAPAAPKPYSGKPIKGPQANTLPGTGTMKPYAMLKELELAPGDTVQFKKGGWNYTITQMKPNGGIYAKGPNGVTKGFASYAMPFKVTKADGSPLALKGTSGVAPAPVAQAAPTKTLAQITAGLAPGDSSPNIGDLPDGSVIQTPQGVVALVKTSEKKDYNGKAYVTAYDLSTGNSFEPPAGVKPSKVDASPSTIAAAASILTKLQQQTTGITTASSVGGQGGGLAVAGPPPEFAGAANNHAAKAVMEKATAASPLTSDQKQAVGSYVGSSSSINAALRDSQSKISPNLAKQILAMEKIVKNAAPAEEAFTVIRKTTNSEWVNASADDVIQDNGFFSASWDPTAISEGGVYGSGGSSTQVEVRVLCPKGTKAIYPDGFGQGLGGEREIILPRAALFTVLKQEKKPNGATVLWVKLESST